MILYQSYTVLKLGVNSALVTEVRAVTLFSLPYNDRLFTSNLLCFIHYNIISHRLGTFVLLNHFKLFIHLLQAHSSTSPWFPQSLPRHHQLERIIPQHFRLDEGTLELSPFPPAGTQLRRFLKALDHAY